MQYLYDIEKSRDIVDGLISYYKNRIETDRLYCEYDPLIGKIYNNGTLENCNCAYEIQNIMKNNIELFTSVDSIRGISFCNTIEGQSFGSIGFVHYSPVYNSLERLIPLSRRHNMLQTMIQEPENMFSVWDTMSIIYRSDVGSDNVSFNRIIDELNKNELIRSEYTSKPDLKVNSISIDLKEVQSNKISMRASFSYTYNPI